MGFFAKILGTVERAFQLGLGGPQLKQGLNTVAGAIDARDAADSTLVQVRVADPLGDFDAVNQRTLQNALSPTVVTPGTLFGANGGLYASPGSNALFGGSS